MRVYKLKQDLQAHLKKVLELQNAIGLVPTMGALHQGHLSLVTTALKDNEVVVVSIFVNPTQFNNQNDLHNYPRTLDSDLKLLETLKNSNIIVYAPEASDVYQDEITAQSFSFDGLEHEMEGEFRKGHFNGVATVVKNLFEIIKPHNAYFGEKDFQQLQIVRKLVEITGFDINIIGCPILRENDGLAMSSRNGRLTQEQRNVVPFIYKTLKTAKVKFGTKSANEVSEWVKSEFANHKLLALEYFTIANETTLKPVKRKNKQNKCRAFIAVFVGDVRLIDNIELN
ncbi:pantoate--beta-alanine ligase [Paucihalobacter sp.]|uniref:pantoate--beta-alanine ligase n=1 Tax=Paucihalobacter sp. TaxID=2850405 RepID=UPI002FE254C7